MTRPAGRACRGPAWTTGPVPGLRPARRSTWARRSLSRVGYEELLSDTAESSRVAVAADLAYLLDAGEDGELRVRGVAGAGPPWLAPGSVTWSAARAGWPAPRCP